MMKSEWRLPLRVDWDWLRKEMISFPGGMEIFSTLIGWMFPEVLGRIMTSKVNCVPICQTCEYVTLCGRKSFLNVIKGEDSYNHR